VNFKIFLLGPVITPSVIPRMQMGLSLVTHNLFVLKRLEIRG
jgi:hypothetical protein